MEIFIVGVVIVALMVYVSTRIKKSAAQAYEPETIDAEDFTINKPAGFINPVNDDSTFAFEAYTKDFGTGEAKDFRQARARLRVLANSSFDAICKNAKQTGGKIKSKNFSENAPQGQRTFLLETESAENDVPVFSSWKIVESRDRRKIYELQVSVLEDHKIKFADEIAEMIESFAVK
jgi:hypothetical protein